MQAFVEEELDALIKYLWGHLGSLYQTRTNWGTPIWVAKGTLTPYYLEVEPIQIDTEGTPTTFQIRLLSGDTTNEVVDCWNTSNGSQEQLNNALNKAAGAILLLVEKTKS